MTFSRLIKVAGAVLGLVGNVHAEGDTSDGHVHAERTLTSMVVPATNDPLSALRKNVASGAISGGLGVNYVGRFTFDNAMAKVDLAKGQMGTELSIINAPDGFSGFSGDSTPGEAIAITPTKSMGWNDTASNPDVQGATDIEKDGFGWGHNSRWYLVDLSKLSAGNYYVSIKAERYDDGQANEMTPEVLAVPAVLDATGKVMKPEVLAVPAKPLPSDDDLIPALTVWDGYQNRGSHLHWFPNKFQKTTTPFWAEMLKPEANLVGTNTAKNGFDTAFEAANDDIAQVSGVIRLNRRGIMAKNNRYLTIALGGDDRSPASKHDVNYKLTVKVYKK